MRRVSGILLIVLLILGGHRLRPPPSPPTTICRSCAAVVSHPRRCSGSEPPPSPAGAAFIRRRLQLRQRNIRLFHRNAAARGLQLARLTAVSVRSSQKTCSAGLQGAFGGGGFPGYNTQWQDLILGVEATYTHTNLNTTASSSPIGRVFPGIATAVALNAAGRLDLTDYGEARFRADTSSVICCHTVRLAWRSDERATVCLLLRSWRKLRLEQIPA